MNKSRNIRVNSGLGRRRRLYVGEIAAFISRFHTSLLPLDVSAQLHEKKDKQRLYPTRQDLHHLPWMFAGWRDSERSSPLFTHSDGFPTSDVLRRITIQDGGRHRRWRWADARRWRTCLLGVDHGEQLPHGARRQAPSVSLRWIVSASSSRTRS